MSPGASKNFACPHCDKRFQWATKIADRRVKCPNCEKRIRVPTVPGRVAEAIDPLPEKPAKAPAPETDTYDLDLTGLDDDQVDRPPTAAQQAAAQTGRCPACNQSIKPNAVICIKCGYNLKKGKRMQTQVRDDEDEQAKSKTVPVSVPGGAMASVGTSPISRSLEDREDEATASRFVDLWLPLILIVVGLGVRFVEQLNFAANPTEGIVGAAIVVGVELIINVPMLLIGMIVAVKLLDVVFGPLGKALYKMVAVVIGPTAIGAIIAYLIGGLMGSFVGGFVSFGAYWALLSVLFDLEGMEALYLIVILWALNWLATLIVFGVVLTFLF
jgi:DNA-directed RNA polymerase subunit RPC12/RpoP